MKCITKCLFLDMMVAAAATRAFAAPSVSNVTYSQDPASRNVTVSYELSGDDAVVTFDLLLDGVSVGVEKLVAAVGDVNRIVRPGKRLICWLPTAEWPGQNLSGAVSARVTAWPKDNPPDYMVLDLCDSAQRRYYSSVAAIPLGVTNAIYKTNKMVMRKIPAAGVSWRMGGGDDPGNNYSDWREAEVFHRVTFTKNYYMGVYPVTEGQYAVLETGVAVDEKNADNYLPRNGSSYNDLRGGVSDGINWPDNSEVKVDSIVDKIRSRTGIATFDLPTEAEWEYACRAGTPTSFSNGDNASSPWAAAPASIAWDRTSAGARKAVGLLADNNWGLYDCHGNVYEICLDWYLCQPYAEGSEQTDPKGPKSTDSYKGGTPVSRCCRGGNYSSDGGRTRSAARESVDPSASLWSLLGHGFRLKCAATAL